MRTGRKSSNALRAAIAVLVSVTMITSGVPTTAIARAVEEVVSVQGTMSAKDSSTQVPGALTETAESASTREDGTWESSDGSSQVAASLAPESNASGVMSKKQDTRGSISVRIEVQGIADEAKGNEFAVTVQNAKELYLNDANEFVKDEAKLIVARADGLSIADVPVGTYTIREASDNRAVEGYTFDEKASTTEVKLQVTEDETAEARLIIAYEPAETKEAETGDSGEKEAQPSVAAADETEEISESKSGVEEENQAEDDPEAEAEDKKQAESVLEHEPEAEQQAEPKPEEEPAVDEQIEVDVQGDEDPVVAETPKAKAAPKANTSATEEEDDYVEREETNNLNDLLDTGSLTITSKGKTYDLADLAEGEKVEIEEGEPFTLHLSFAENDQHGFRKDETPPSLYPALWHDAAGHIRELHLRHATW